MLTKKSYKDPQIKVCDYITKRNLTIGIGEGTHFDFGGKKNNVGIDETEDDIDYNVWDSKQSM